MYGLTAPRKNGILIRFPKLPGCLPWIPRVIMPASPQFNADAIVQYGYMPQWTDNPRAIGTLFGPSLPMGAAGHAAISDNWKAAWTWYYDGIFGAQPFIPGQAAIDDDDVLNENPFSSGKVAMATTHLWYTCCIDTAAVPNWDVAVMPSYNGVVTSKMHGDTFAIMKTSKTQKQLSRYIPICWAKAQKNCMPFMVGCRHAPASRKLSSPHWIKNLLPTLLTGRSFWTAFLIWIFPITRRMSPIFPKWQRHSRPWAVIFELTIP